uniref:Uncharacterized protein n=1 Tax=Chromera velia CCMP2878 TaxID=1169474 RepID=A0A0G4HKE6_9ALVE|eukprot:Cvel_28502.t1-p1 / transcript=Cvel_28502.t1 / gene=Cvel_28502 / organism=Chromera_velia_CCMP2878 / gene_product=hypothetical protein / transcript_product=hypothetical protein / location=Cvel_scaffold3744:9781-10548(-) / protein_length=256 / sequence_SO=supercontig / SO=protein_coding / is_pseudo=false
MQAKSPVYLGREARSMYLVSFGNCSSTLWNMPSVAGQIQFFGKVGETADPRFPQTLASVAPTTHLSKTGSSVSSLPAPVVDDDDESDEGKDGERESSEGAGAVGPALSGESRQAGVVAEKEGETEQCAPSEPRAAHFTAPAVSAPSPSSVSAEALPSTSNSSVAAAAASGPHPAKEGDSGAPPVCCVDPETGKMRGWHEYCVDGIGGRWRNIVCLKETCGLCGEGEIVLEQTTAKVFGHVLEVVIMVTCSNSANCT